MNIPILEICINTYFTNGIFALWTYVLQMAALKAIIFSSNNIFGEKFSPRRLHNVLTSYSSNHCEMTFMFQYPQFVEISLPSEVQKVYPKYALYGYGEGGITEQLRKMNFKGIPVIFIPGSSGSHKQGRSLASVSLRKSLNSRTPFHFNYFMIDFNEEWAAIFGGVLEDQTNFVLHCIKKVLTLYDKNRKQDSVILIGHSMGGLLAKGVFMNPNFNTKSVRLVLSLATPHKYPLFQPDHHISAYYRNLKNFWRNNAILNETLFVSIGGGLKDILVHSDVTYDHYSDINVVTTAIPGVWLPNDHLSIMWCRQLVITLIRAMFDSVDITTKKLTTDKEYMKKVFQYHLLKRSAGKKFSTSLTSRFQSFERTMNWFENLQRQFTVTEPRGLTSNHYIMIRLFSEANSESAFIEAYNVNVKDWIFVCSADIVYNSIRMCDSGENISNMTEIAPVDLSLKLKRKFIYLNLLELKAKSFTHVIIRLPPSDSYMSVNVDVHQPLERNLNYHAPRYFFTSEKIIEKTQKNVAYYTVKMIGFEYIWQSFDLKVKALSCRTEKNQAVITFITPWAIEDQHFIFLEKTFLLASLNLVSPKPKNFSATSYPLLKLHLDPTCQYEVLIQTSLVGMFAQGARYYSLMLPAFIGTVTLLTLRQEMKHLDLGKCVLFHSALSSAVRPYYIILQISVLGSKILGLGIFLSVLPEPDFMILQELNMDSFFLTILLYAVAVIVTYSLGAAVYLGIVLSGQAAQKMALRLIAKGVSRVFNWPEWVVATLHRMPFLVAAFLISLSLSTTGSLALWLGAFFYFLKLCKMYEEYLEDWFHYSLKMIAKKVKDIFTRKSNENSEAMNRFSDKKKTKTGDGENALRNKKKPEPKTEVVESQGDDNEQEIDILTAIHFHISVFMVWLFTAALYIPSLLTWVKNYHFSASLEKDPALLPSIIISASGAVLWQPGVPKPNKLLSKITSSSLFLLATTSIIYSPLAMYRLGYIFSISILIVAINQAARA